MISIIIPVYNVAGYLEKCIESCLAQTYSDFEIIAINDGSTDNSFDILKKYAELDARIKIVDQVNQGVAATRLIGLTKAIGEYVTFVDSDDMLPVNALEILYSTISLYDADIAVGDYYECTKKGKFIKTDFFFEKQLITSTEYLDLILDQRTQWGLGAKLYKKELFTSIVDVPILRLGEDAALLVQLINNSNSIVCVNMCVYYYVQRPNSAIHISNNPNIADVYRFRVWIAKYLKEKHYCNENLLKKFLVIGYIECIFHGGAKFISKTDYVSIICSYNEVKNELLLWQKIVFRSAYNMPLIGGIIITGLHKIWNVKLFFKYSGGL